MQDKAVPRHGYVRSMKGWWTTDPFFMRYMAREATALAVLAYALILMLGLVRLAQGEAEWNDWLAALRSPWSIALHVLLLVAMAVHAHSWFEVMPKTMPMLFIGGRRVEERAIMRVGWAAAVLATLALLALAWWLRP
ncbi:fumarate reductase subunit C [Caenimonas terrae]|uniref:Fumarate reductase subunit C n=1 Tax=Caenimonas terrae TaxID=696074 RepID=A0ABW0NJW3_9BURK